MKTIKLSTLLIFLFVNQSFAISVKGCFGKINQVLNHASNKGKSVLYRGDFNKKLYLDELKALKESSSLAKEEGSYSTIEKRLALITYLEETSALGLKSFDQLTTERQKNIDRLVKYVNSLNLDQGLSRYEVKKMTALYYDASSEKAGFVSRILKRLKLNPEELLFEKIALDTLEFGVIKRIEEDFLRNNGLMESVRPKEKALAFTKKFFE